METLNMLGWVAFSILAVLLGAAVGSLVYPWLKYAVQQWMAHWQRETDKLGAMQHEGVDVPDAVTCKCDICGKVALSSNFVVIPWSRLGVLTDDVLESGRIVVCRHNQECRTKGHLLKLRKSGYLSTRREGF